MKDPFAPGSQLMSPARPLPPKPEPFGSSSTAHFRHPSLPAKLNIGMDLPTFGSSTRTTSKSKDGSSNGLSYYACYSMSKFSDQANQDNEKSTNMTMRKQREKAIRMKIQVDQRSRKMEAGFTSRYTNGQAREVYSRHSTKGK